MLPMGNYQVEGFAQIRVIGVGGGGSNAVNRMIQANMMGIAFIAVNTDAQALLLTETPNRIRIGDKLTRGLGAGGNPGLEAKAGEENAERLDKAVKDSYSDIITAGMAVANQRAEHGARKNQPGRGRLQEDHVGGRLRVDGNR